MANEKLNNEIITILSESGINVDGAIVKLINEIRKRIYLPYNLFTKSEEKPEQINLGNGENINITRKKDTEEDLLKNIYDENVLIVCKNTYAHLLSLKNQIETYLTRKEIFLSTNATLYNTKQIMKYFWPKNNDDAKKFWCNFLEKEKKVFLNEMESSIIRGFNEENKTNKENLIKCCVRNNKIRLIILLGLIIASFIINVFFKEKSSIMLINVVFWIIFLIMIVRDEKIIKTLPSSKSEKFTKYCNIKKKFELECDRRINYFKTDDASTSSVNEYISDIIMADLNNPEVEKDIYIAIKTLRTNNFLELSSSVSDLKCNLPMKEPRVYIFIDKWFYIILSVIFLLYSIIILIMEVFE